MTEWNGLNEKIIKQEMKYLYLGIFFNIDATISKNIPLFHNNKMQYIINNVFSNHDQDAAKILNYIEMCFYVDHKCGIAVSKIAILASIFNSICVL